MRILKYKYNSGYPVKVKCLLSSYLLKKLHVPAVTLFSIILLCLGCGDEFGILLPRPRQTVSSIIQVSPAPYTFSSIRAGQSSNEVVFTINNTGTSAVELSSTGLADTTNYTLTSSPVSPVAAGGSTTFTARFNPHTVGIKTSTITVTHDAMDSPAIINISGLCIPGELYWTGSDKTINCVNRDGTGNQALLTVPGIPLDIELYIPGEQIYWTEYTGNAYQIRRAGLDGSNSATFDDGQYTSATHHGPTTIAIDPVNGYIYFSVYKTNGLVNDIWRSALDTFEESKWKTVSRPYIYGLCLDTIRKNMYFTMNTYWDITAPSAGAGKNGDACYGNYETGGNGFSTPVNGTGPLTDSVSMRDIASDSANSRIFYVTYDSSGYRIIKERYDFQERTVWIPTQSAYGIQKIALDLTARKIYWTTTIGNYIYRADLDTANSNIEIFLSLDSKPNGIVVVP